MTSETYHTVQSYYSSIANQTTTQHQTKDNEDKIAEAFGYSAHDLRSLPENTNLGLSCGNPVAYANIKNGETVVDLGSGAGIDVILASRKVGPEGRVIGIDMTKEMITLARRNIQAANLPTDNVSFIESSITSSIPLPDSSVDCIISNCVINLVPRDDKPRVFREMTRLLKPGGRVAISDILARRELPGAIRSDMALYVGCIAGASLVDEYREFLEGSGFGDVLIVDTKADINLYKQSSYLCMDQGQGQGGGCGCGNAAGMQETAVADVDFNEWVGSFRIYAVKRDRDV